MMIFSSLTLLVLLKITGTLGNTNIIQSLICLWSLFEMPLYLLQFILAAIYSHYIVIAFTLAALLALISINIYMGKILLPRRHSKDIVLNHWISEHPKTY